MKKVLNTLRTVAAIAFASMTAAGTAAFIYSATNAGFSGMEAGDILGFLGGILGAALGAILTIAGTLQIQRQQVRNERKLRRQHLTDALANLQHLLDGLAGHDPTRPANLRGFGLHYAATELRDAQRTFDEFGPAGTADDYPMRRAFLRLARELDHLIRELDGALRVVTQMGDSDDARAAAEFISALAGLTAGYIAPLQQQLKDRR